MKEIRRHSYASVLYTEIRSYYVHEYKTGGKAYPEPQTRRIDVEISYCNDMVGLNQGEIHMVHIHYKWVKKIALSILNSTKSIIESGQPQSRPAKWWIEG